MNPGQKLEKPYQCGICMDCFKEPSGLKSHLRTHNLNKPYQCKICNKSFMQAGNLKRHQQTHSGGLHTCNICNKSYTEKCNLKRHLQTHTGVKPYKCKTCNKSFAYTTSLKNHLLTHTGEKPHKCKICDYSFSQPGNLNKHLLTHIGEKPHTCKICKKSFKLNSNLRQHLLTHNRQNPHTCNICNMSFTHEVYLKTHVRTHTRKKPHFFKICNNDVKHATGSLPIHLLAQCETKAYICKMCNNSFTCDKTLNKHLLSHETLVSVKSLQSVEEDNVNCNIIIKEELYVDEEYSNIEFKHQLSPSNELPVIDATTSRQATGSLPIHLLAQCETKAYICKMCNNSFTCDKTLNKHLLSHETLVSVKSLQSVEEDNVNCNIIIKEELNVDEEYSNIEFKHQLSPSNEIPIIDATTSYEEKCCKSELLSEEIILKDEKYSDDN